MLYKKLYIWVEGPDDERFFNRIVLPILSTKYDSIKVIQYAKETLTWRKNFIKSMIAMEADYIFVADVDSASCITAKKEKIKHDLPNINDNKIIVVIKEIESWYLAGLSKTAYKEIGISKYKGSTNDLTKEEFNNLVPKKFKDSRIDFMQEILQLFDVEIAKDKNISLNYLLQKLAELQTIQEKEPEE